VAQAVGHLPSKSETLNSNLSTTKKEEILDSSCLPIFNSPNNFSKNGTHLTYLKVLSLDLTIKRYKFIIYETHM
jgi:hypothetical protein